MNIVFVNSKGEARILPFSNIKWFVIEALLAVMIDWNRTIWN